MTNIEVDFIPDPDIYIYIYIYIYIFSEKETRGGISYISNRYSQANNKYFKWYNQKQESKNII